MGGRATTRIAISLAAAAGLLFVPGALAADRHVDCDAPPGGDGSEATPLDSVGNFDLGPGDRLLLRRGTQCAGRLRLTGGGSDAQPAIVGAYGSGSLPRITGTLRDVVLVQDASNLVVRDLELSNPGAGGPLGEGEEILNGIRVTVNSGISRNLTITGLSIHDVLGDLTKTPEGSAAIQISVTGPPPARFQDLTIESNRIDSVSRSAISITGTNHSDRPTADQPWPEASTGVVVRDNRIDLIAGDGIVPRGTDGALVEGNVVSRGNLAGRPLLHPQGPMCNAGIWTFRANNTLIRANEVFGMEHNGCDGTGFDVDYWQDGTVIQGNYSHQNKGGFILLCGDEQTHRAEVRFNLSVDDATMINHGPCGISSGIIGDLSGIRMFNNTVVGDTPSVTMQLGKVNEMFAPGTFRFENNLVYARQPFERIPCGDFCRRNAFFNMPFAGTEYLTGDPLLAGPITVAEGMSAAQGFRLRTGSPLIQAGADIENPGPGDFFGSPIPAVPSIGFDQSRLLPVPAPNKACPKARSALKKAKRKVRVLNRRLKKLRRKKAERPRIRKAARKLRKARAAVRRQHRAVNRTCR